MSDPRHKQREPDELDLDAETIKDLDPGEEDADGVRGGVVANMTHTCNCQAVSNINCVAN
jgi:hypothetical protein